MVEELKGRTQETEFIAEMAKRRPPQRRELDVRVDSTGAVVEPEPEPDPAPAVGSGPPSRSSPKRR